MTRLLNISGWIDALNECIGRWLGWLVLAAVLISTLNAISRKTLNLSSNAYLEVQWYLFSAIFLLAAGYTLLRNEHVRIDVFSTRLSARSRAVIDLLGLLLFLLPFSILLMYLSWPFFLDAFRNHETSSNAGGLLRWPVKLLIPAGFALLILQAFSEMIKRIAFLKGRIEDPAVKQHHKSMEEELVDAIKAEKPLP